MRNSNEFQPSSTSLAKACSRRTSIQFDVIDFGQIALSSLEIEKVKTQKYFLSFSSLATMLRVDLLILYQVFDWIIRIPIKLNTAWYLCLKVWPKHLLNDILFKYSLLVCLFAEMFSFLLWLTMWSVFNDVAIVLSFLQILLRKNIFGKDFFINFPIWHETQITSLNSNEVVSVKTFF